MPTRVEKFCQSYKILEEILQDSLARACMNLPRHLPRQLTRYLAKILLRFLARRLAEVLTKILTRSYKINKLLSLGLARFSIVMSFTCSEKKSVFCPQVLFFCPDQSHFRREWPSPRQPASSAHCPCS